MKQSSLSAFWFFAVSIVGMTLSVSSYSQGLGDVKQLCGNATTANKAMAKQAGYDLDALCSEVTASAQPKLAVPEAPKVARPTVATETTETPAASAEQVATTAAPVAVAGVGAAKPAEDLKPFGYDLFANAPIVLKWVTARFASACLPTCARNPFSSCRSGWLMVPCAGSGFPSTTAK